jgi:threonine dehydratase
MSVMDFLPDRTRIEDAAGIVYEVMLPTPQYNWALLSERVGLQVWVKHENDTPIGAFKIRGGLVYFHELMKRHPSVKGVVSATRGNHGQSVGFAARLHDVPATIVVPKGNSLEKNDAMRALGVTLVESGEDFQAAREHAAALSQRDQLHMVPSFHPDLVRGVATYSLELFRAVPQIDVMYVPIGLGSGICGAIAAREALGRTTEIVGVVSRHAPAYALSLAAGQVVQAAASTSLADGLACRQPEFDALSILMRHVSHIVQVTDEEVASAMRLLFSTTHNVAEGAGAAGLAAILQERNRLAGKNVAFTLSGGNVDRAVFGPMLTA